MSGSSSGSPTTTPGPGLWWSIEVLNGPFSADRWRDAHGRALFEAAVTNGALDWSWQPTEWGLVLEVEFPQEEAWSAFRGLPGVPSRLRPRPHLGAGGAALPVSPDPVVAARTTEAIMPASEELPTSSPVPAAVAASAA